MIHRIGGNRAALQLEGCKTSRQSFSAVFWPNFYCTV